MMTEICSICYKNIDEHKDTNGKVYWSQGHNAQPLSADDTSHPSMLNHTRCCDSCNDLVLEVRMMQAFGWDSVPKKVIGWFNDAKTASDMMMAHMRLTQLVEAMAQQEVNII